MFRTRNAPLVDKVFFYLLALIYLVVRYFTVIQVQLIFFFLLVYIIIIRDLNIKKGLPTTRETLVVGDYITTDGVLCLCIIWTEKADELVFKEIYKSKALSFLKENNQHKLSCIESKIKKKVKLEEGVYFTIVENSMYYNAEKDYGNKFENFHFKKDYKKKKRSFWNITEKYDPELVKKFSFYNVFTKQQEITNGRLTFRKNTQYKVVLEINQIGKKYYCTKEFK